MSVLRSKVDMEGETVDIEAQAPMWEGALLAQLRCGPAGCVFQRGSVVLAQYYLKETQLIPV